MEAPESKTSKIGELRMGEWILIRGKNLYVEQYGEAQPDALLYLHGGPGASCVDFCYHQAKALGDSLRVVAIDQRGVLRSDPVEPDESFSLQDLIEDCEALRVALGIRKWSVLGHSFGGYLAFRYAHQYPESVHKVLYEAPCFDAKLSTESLMRKALYVAQQKRLDCAADIQAHLEKDYGARELWDVWGTIIQKLGKHKDEVYKYTNVVKQFVLTDR